MFDTVLFDLDGTLTDPFEGISNSIIYALKKFGIAAPDKPLLKKFIGPPLTESFSEYCGLNHSDALRAVDYYREYFSVAGIFENKPYEGVCELLSGLKERGYTAIVATSKPEQFAKAIVQHFGLEQYFKEICGATMDQSRTQKADVIAYALKKCEIKDKKRAVMVGDRKHDIICTDMEVRKNCLKRGPIILQILLSIYCIIFWDKKVGLMCLQREAIQIM